MSFLKVHIHTKKGLYPIYYNYMPPCIYEIKVRAIKIFFVPLFCTNMAVINIVKYFSEFNER